jgi:enoyl-CoA hydratase
MLASKHASAHSRSKRKEAGLINAIVDKEALLDEAVGLGSKIAQFAPEAVAVCLHAVGRGLNATIDEGLAIEAKAFAKMVPTAATREGLDAFITAHS